MFKKKNVCHTESLCLRKAVKNCQKLPKTDRFWPFLTVFGHLWLIFLKHSDLVWQTFFLNTVTQCDQLLFLNTVTQCDKHFLQHSDLFFSGKFILRKNQKNWLPLKNKFQHRRKIGLEYLPLGNNLKFTVKITLASANSYTHSSGFPPPSPMHRNSRSYWDFRMASK